MATEPTAVLGTSTWPLTGSGSDEQKMAEENEKEELGYDDSIVLNIWELRVG